MTAGQRTEFVTVVTCRIQNLCRVVSQAELKNSKAEWLSAMPWKSATAKPLAPLKRSAPAGGPRVYGFDAEVGLGFRVELGGEKVLSLPPTVPGDADDLDIVIGEWADGEKHPLPGLTYGRLRDLSRPKQNQHQEELWVGEHVITKHQLHLRQRVDRQLLLSLVEQKRQILMVRADLFGDIERTNTCSKIQAIQPSARRPSL